MYVKGDVAGARVNEALALVVGVVVMGCAGEARGAGARVAIGYEEKGARTGCGG